MIIRFDRFEINARSNLFIDFLSTHCECFPPDKAVMHSKMVLIKIKYKKSIFSWRFLLFDKSRVYSKIHVCTSTIPKVPKIRVIKTKILRKHLNEINCIFIEKNM